MVFDLPFGLVLVAMAALGAGRGAVVSGTGLVGVFGLARGSLIYEPEVRGRFADLGLVGDAAREDPAVFKEPLGGVLIDVAPKGARLHQDPEIQALAQDPELQQLVASGDTLALITHPYMKRIVERVSREL